MISKDYLSLCNKIQEEIFKALSDEEKNIFMVGDAKQSIYSFRRSDPGLFLNRKDKYEDYDESKDNYPCKITLDGNFRSKKNIIDIINFMFSQLMSENLGDIRYTESEKLKCLSDYNNLEKNKEKNKEEEKLELCLLDMQKRDMSSDEAEANYIAKKIKEMINNKYLVREGNGDRPVTYGDFCILLRNFNGHANVFEKCLKNNNIPVISRISKSFLDSFEVNIILSLLKVIDNPVDDVSIVSILMSPIYGFSPDKLSAIKKNNQKELYFLIRDEATEKKDKDCIKFITDLEEYRELSKHISIYKLILEILNRTGYDSIIQVMKDKETRINNLRLFINCAKNYDNIGNNSLSTFLIFINKIKTCKSSGLSSSTTAINTDAVNIMSIHKSKGLEFPVCILGGCSINFNKQFDDMVINDKLGIGLKLNDIDNLVKYDTILRYACLIEEERRLFSEELRILYVALTRAKDKLIIVTSIKNKKNNILNMIGLNRMISPYILKKSRNFSDWIIMSLIRHKDAGKLREFFGVDEECSVLRDSSEGHLSINIIKYEDIISKEENNKLLEANISYSIEDIDKTEKEIKSKINFEYPMKELLGISPKMNASDLIKDDDQVIELLDRPKFRIKSKVLTPVEKGTALHLFLQFADYKRSIKNINKEIERLVESGFITNEQSGSLDIEKINKFLNSDLIKRALKSKNFEREYKFNVDISLSELGYKFEEKVVVQGAIDMFFEEDDGFVIVDYKTDRIKDLNKFVDIYEGQLNVYKIALEKIKNKRVKESIIYSLYNGTEILV